MNKEELARLIYELIGPRSNIKDLTNCMTRVRVQLHKEPSDEALKAIKGVMGVNHSGEELQIILGPGKATAVKKLIANLMEQDDGSTCENVDANSCTIQSASVAKETKASAQNEESGGHVSLLKKALTEKFSPNPADSTKKVVSNDEEPTKNTFLQATASTKQVQSNSAELTEKTQNKTVDLSAKVECEAKASQENKSQRKSEFENKSIKDLARSAQIGDGKDLHQAIKTKNATPAKLFLKKIANIFMPLIPAFIGCGLITGFINIVVKLDPSLTDLSIIKILMLAGSAIFYGLNLFVGVNAAKEFRGTPIIGGVLAAILTQPALSNIELFGMSFTPGRGGIIAVILIAGFAAYLENLLHKIVPDILDLFLTPLVTITVSTFIALIICQPLGGFLAENIGKFATGAINGGGALIGFVLGGTFLPLIMVGIHQGLTPIHAQLLASYGVNILLPILAMAGAGQVGASCAVYFITKNQDLKKTIASALPVGIMGVGEPLIYGVTLPLGKPFLGACVGGACGGAVQAAFVTGATVMGLSGLPLAACTDKPMIYLLGVLTAYLGGFVATWLIGFDDPS